MNIQYDTEADALYVTLAKGKISRTVEISEYVIADLDQSERILGLEMLDVSINPVAQSVLAGNPIHELPFAIAE